MTMREFLSGQAFDCYTHFGAHPTGTACGFGFMPRVPDLCSSSGSATIGRGKRCTGKNRAVGP